MKQGRKRIKTKLRLKSVPTERLKKQVIPKIGFYKADGFSIMPGAKTFIEVMMSVKHEHPPQIDINNEFKTDAELEAIYDVPQSSGEILIYKI